MIIFLSWIKANREKTGTRTVTDRTDKTDGTDNAGTIGMTRDAGKSPAPAPRPEHHSIRDQSDLSDRSDKSNEARTVDTMDTASPEGCAPESPNGILPDVFISRTPLSRHTSGNFRTFRTG